MTPRRTSVVALAATFGTLASSAQAAVTEFHDASLWEDAVGRFTTIDFTGFPEGTFITDQYADLGVTFTDGDDSVLMAASFVNDGWGLNGGIEDITISFDSPQLWIAADHPGVLEFELYHDDELLFASTMFGGGGAGFFAGLLSDRLFDEVVLRDPVDDVHIDDLRFGVPTPATLVVFLLAGLQWPRSRCRCVR